MEKLKSVSEQLAVAVEEGSSGAIACFQDQGSFYRQHQNLLYDLTMAIHRGTTLDRILQLTADRLVEALQTERATILLLKYTDPLFKTRQARSSEALNDPAAPQRPPQRLPRAKITVVAQATSSHQSDSQPQLHQSFWLHECFWCQEAFTNAPRPVPIADLAEFLRGHPDRTCGPIFAPDVRPTGVNVPLVGSASGSSSSTTVLGFLVLEHSQARPWLAEELRLLEIVAASLSTAILHSQTIQHVQALVEDRNAQLHSSLDVQAKLYEKSRQQVEQLRRLNQVKDEILSTLSHELNTPLTTMKMAVQMLRQPGLPLERQAKYLDILEEELRRESNLVKDLLNLQRLESNSVEPFVQTVDLKQFLRNLANSFEAKWAEPELKLSLSLPKSAIKLQTDANSLDRILMELLTNAGKYSEPGTTVHLHIAHDRTANQVVMTLTNIGVGISEEDLPFIFDKFRRGTGVTERAIAGTGLGLALVKSLVMQLNGTIAVTSRPKGDGGTSGRGDGSTPPNLLYETCFTVTLPQLAATAS
ncbi:GAF domain-containing sensor histidine kinase [[Phormidium] sp. ETS-05]|uniref:sensor histidine kinase n=1 Tax=[Phormidium] sp. ETS-05 TaxID=222819 RepID=UPI0018EED383|nr:GAF domain-containing sensor histidine kinase [[Phormidium] sp. ETS-05]